MFADIGDIIEEDTVIVRRSYAFIRFKDRHSAERAKRMLDMTDVQGSITVRDAEMEQAKARISVQFQCSCPNAPGKIREQLNATFSKYGSCSIEIPGLRNKQWRKLAFVTFHGEPISANLAASEAVRSVRFVSTRPVCCKFEDEHARRVSAGESSCGHNLPISGTEATVNTHLRTPLQCRGRNLSIPPSVDHPSFELGVNGMPANPEATDDDLVKVFVPSSAIQSISEEHNQIDVPEEDEVAPVNETA